MFDFKPKLSFLAIFACVGLVVFAAPSKAQETVVEIKMASRFDMEERETPNFAADNYNVSDELEWIEVGIEYKIRGSAEWVDGLKFRWHMLLTGGDEPFILMKKDVEYKDVKVDTSGAGEQYKAVVFLRPRSIRRYYDDRGRFVSTKAMVAVEVFHEGRRIAIKRSPIRGNIPENWWTRKSSNLTRIEDMMVDRTQTPFENLDYDYFNVIVQE